MIRNRWGLIMLTVLVFSMVLVSPVWAAGIVMDGKFGDWEGQPHLTDPIDTENDYFDITSFYWGNNPDDETLYFMLERADGIKNLVVETVIYFDVNDNGQFQDAVDRVAVVHYRPHPSKGRVNVEVYPAQKDKHSQLIGSYQGEWGEADEEGSRRWEFMVPMADLNLQAGQSIRMYAYTTDNDGNNNNNDHHDYQIMDRLPDQGDIQWSPIPIIGMPGLAVILAGGVAAAVYVMKKRGKLWG